MGSEDSKSGSCHLRYLGEIEIFTLLFSKIWLNFRKFKLIPCFMRGLSGCRSSLVSTYSGHSRKPLGESSSNRFKHSNAAGSSDVFSLPSSSRKNGGALNSLPSTVHIASVVPSSNSSSVKNGPVLVKRSMHDLSL